MKKFLSMLFIVLSIISFGKSNEHKIKYDLIGKVFDYGQNIVALELDTKNIKVDKNSLSKETFKVFAKSELPKGVEFPLDENTKVYGIFDTEREITNISVNKNGNIVLELKYGQSVNGSSTLSYITGAVSRNVLLDLTYRVEQQKEFKEKNGNIVSVKSVYVQGKVVDEEADKFISRKTDDDIHYQYFVPEKIDKTKKYPLIVWFHGNGEGGYENYRNNVSQKLANRGVVAFGEKKTQEIFGGAYVIAPQAPDTWYNNYSKGYIEKVKKLIDKTVKENNIDTDRIYVFGASAGGYMSIRMAIEYPNSFAGVNVSAPALNLAEIRGGVKTTEDELKKIENIPLWFVHSENDPTVEYKTSSKFAYNVLKSKGAYLTLYPDVKIGSTEYNGHWSWVYTLRNMPTNQNGETVFEWMAKQKLNKK